MHLGRTSSPIRVSVTIIGAHDIVRMTLYRAHTFTSLVVIALFWVSVGGYRMIIYRHLITSEEEYYPKIQCHDNVIGRAISMNPMR